MSDELTPWLDLVRAAESQNYWPGPRPLRFNDPAGQLVGREQDVRNLTKVLGENQLLVLYGAAGDGKSSLLQSGIRPTLSRLGRIVLYCADWSGMGSEAGDGEEFIRGRLGTQLVAAGVADAPGFTDELDRRYGERTVVVLDQFEEVMRHDPALFAAMSRWVRRVLEQTQIRIVISLREEYLPRLRLLQYDRRDFRVEPKRDQASIRSIICSGMRKDGAGEPVITQDAEETLVDLWCRAGGESPESTFGLLHLQALLYMLWLRSGGRVVDSEVVTSVIGELTDGAKYDDAESVLKNSLSRVVLKDSLSRVVQERLKRCEDVYVQARHGERTLATGAVQIIRRAAVLLSSGGYKVDQDRWHLAELVLAEELEVLGFSGTRGNRFAETLFDNVAMIVDRHRAWLLGGRTDAAPLDYLSAPRALLRADREGRDVVQGQTWADIDVMSSAGRYPWDTDPRSVTAGAMMGSTPAEVLVEVIRTFFFALDWLEAGALIRRTRRRLARGQGYDTGTAISLIHDGFGQGLAEWGSRDEEGPRAFFDLLVAAVGKTIAPSESIDGLVDESYRVAVNLRWKACLVTATFRHVTFVNCDFRNCTFEDCTFEDVVFVNCLLDGASFIRCCFSGGAAEQEDVSPSERSSSDISAVGSTSFTVGLPTGAADVIRSLNRYREYATHGSTDVLFSRIAGLPAAPGRAERGLPVSDVGRGLVICGGRLSAMMFGDSSFPARGLLMLRHLTGTSLEFADQAVGDIELSDVTLRGVTVSAPLGVKPRPPGRLRIRAHDSRLMNVWISSRLEGELELSGKTSVWQLTNISQDFPVVSDDTSSSIRGILDLGEDELRKLAEIALQIDFRTVPGKRELTVDLRVDDG